MVKTADINAKPLKRSAVAIGALACLLTGLAACSQSSIAVTENNEIITSAIGGEQIDLDYITAYSHIARGIRKCWLADKKPLQNSQFFARTNNKQKAKSASIYVHAPAEKPKRGPRIFSVHLKQRASGSELRINNRLLDPVNNKFLISDVRSFVNGETKCPVHKKSYEITPASLAKRDAERALNIPLPKRK